MKARLLYWWRRDGIGYLFMLPFLVLLLIFIVIPVFVALGTSFTNYNMLQKPRWIGLNNYKLLFMDDAIFLTALKNTFVFACIT
ncbi:MAG TPA: sugar ABC transporter permease, partial [Clostridiales bacterium]|nr:sugar ABC transporter permease [Clostridiales bacterium]